MSNNIQRIAMGRLLARHPNICTGHFYGDLREMLRAELKDSLFEEGERFSKNELERKLKKYFPTIYTPGFYPDYYEINRDERKIVIYEVEDTHLLKDEKVRRLARFWFSIDDDLEYDVELFVTDRYGMNERKLPLHNMYFELILNVSPQSDAVKRTAHLTQIELEDM